jgi:hypothetical protein
MTSISNQEPELIAITSPKRYRNSQSGRYDIYLAQPHQLSQNKRDTVFMRGHSGKWGFDDQ